MKKILGMLAVVGLLVLVPLIATAEEPLIMGTTDRVTELSFANCYDAFTWHVLRHTTGALVKLDEETLEIVGDIAESWDISADGMEYTFHIRPGVTFWDGAVCDAQAVKWALDRTIRLDGPEGGVALIKPYIASIEVVNNLTVKIRLTFADAIFLSRITNQVGPALIYSPKSTPENEFARGRYAGTGPYKLVEYVPDQYVKYEAYAGYYGPAPKSKEVVEVMYADAATLRAALEAGNVDFVFRTLAPQDIEDLKKDPDIVIEFFPPSPGVRYLLFNVTQAPVDNPFVRQGIAYAVDRDAIVDQVFSGSVDPIYTMVPNVDPPFFGALPTFPDRDLEKAVALLAKAGYNKNNHLKLNLWYTPKHYGTFEADVATVIKGSLEETGVIDITIQVLEWTAYVQRMGAGGFDMFLLGWHPDYLESSNFLAPWTTESPEPLGTYFNHHPNFEAYDRIMKVAMGTVDTEKRGMLYEAIQILSTQDVMWIPLWGMTDEMVLGWRKGVKGAKLDITMDVNLYLIYKE
jgi:peptide/nickel transport system substrate-binding protein